MVEIKDITNTETYTIYVLSYIEDNIVNIVGETMVVYEYDEHGIEKLENLRTKKRSLGEGCEIIKFNFTTIKNHPPRNFEEVLSVHNINDIKEEVLIRHNLSLINREIGDLNFKIDYSNGNLFLSYYQHKYLYFTHIIAGYNKASMLIEKLFPGYEIESMCNLTITYKKKL